MFDVIFCTEDSKDLALRHINRLAMGEIARRRLWDMHGLRMWKDIAIPGTQLTGWGVATNYYGSTAILRNASLLEFQEIAPGCIGANLNDAIKETADWREASRREQADEKVGLELHAKALAEEEATRSQERADALKRWGVTVGHLCGVRRPKKLSFAEAQDLFNANTITEEFELPSATQWLIACGLEAKQQEEPRLSVDPFAEAEEGLRQIPMVEQQRVKKAS